MNKKLLILLGLMLLIYTGLGQVDMSGARPIAQGGAFTAMSNDANASVWNPAGMESFREMAISLSYSMKYLGIDNNNLNEGNISFVNHLGRRGKFGSYGLSYTHYFDDIYSQGILTLGYAKRLYGKHDGAHTSLGLNLKFINTSWSDGNASVGFDPNDPLVGESSFAPSLDLGLIFVPAKWLRVGVAAKDIIEPDVSISGSGSTDDKENVMPMTLNFGLGLQFGSFKPSFEAEMLTKEINGENPLKIHAGVEADLGQSFSLRGGYGREDATFGFGWKNLGEKVDWGLDYALVYPINELSEEFITTHHVSLNFMIQPPPVPLEDLELVNGTVEIFPKQLVAGNAVTMRAKVVNKSEIKQNKVNISAYYEDDQGNWNLCRASWRESFELGEEKEITLDWTPPADGNYKVYITVDDDGRYIPKINSKIEEFDEKNNTGFGECSVFKTPEGIISPRDNRLTVEKLTLFQEEEPIIPVVFFDDNSSTIDPRFDHMLSIVAERLSENPVVELSIKGFYSNIGDKTEDHEKLAISRAEAVKSSLIKHGAPESQVKVVYSGYDLSASRAGTPEVQLNKQSLNYQLAENRRAEIHAWFKMGEDFRIDIPYTSSISPEALNILQTKIPDIRAILNNNPEVIILCDGYAEIGDEKTAGAVFKKVSDVSKKIRELIDDETLSERIYITQSFMTGADPNKVLVFPVSEGLIFRPLVGDHVIDDYTVDGDDMNLVSIEAEVQAGVDSFAVSIVGNNGNLVRRLAEGKYQIPEGLAWDWRDNSGELLDFENTYFAKLDIIDAMGTKVQVKSDTMGIEVTKQAKRIESLVIVEFIFDEDVPESKFLASRVEYVARRLIKRANKEYSMIDATVAGHTDSIGAEYANIALSNKRANRELTNLRRYMMHLLDMDSEAQLDSWLKEHNVDLKAKGYGETSPYEFIRWGKDGKREKVTLGDNSKPEGRTVNRRVLLDLKSMRINN